MKRRDFLLLRGSKGRAVALSCARLYMRYRDGLTAVGRGESLQTHPFESEPPAEIDTPAPDELFAALERELAAVGTVELTDREWLADDDFRRRMNLVLGRYSARGGRILEPLEPREPLEPLEPREPR